MALFSYIAVDVLGKSHKGMLEAENPFLLRQSLASRGLSPVRVDAVAKRFVRQKQKRKAPAAYLNFLSRQLSILLQGGMPLEKSLRLLAQQTEDAPLKKILLDIHGQILAGHSFAQSLQAADFRFPDSYAAMIAAGERSGSVETVLSYLADHYEAYAQTLRKMQLALIYPAMLLVVAMGVLAFLLVFVFGDVVKAFEQAGHPLPTFTLVMLAISHGLKNWGLPVLLALVLGGVALVRHLKHPARKAAWDHQVLDLPFFGRYVRAINVMRYLTTLSILRRCGVPLLEALLISERTTANAYMRAQLAEAAVAVREGRTLAQALAESGVIPPLVCNMIATGENSGELDRILHIVSKNHIQEVETQLTVLARISEPAIIIFTGLLVLAIALAIMLPILSINQLVK